MNKQKIIAIEAIKKKLLGKRISYSEAYALMDCIATGKLGDIFVAYFVAASFKEGFTDDELYNLTKAMVKTGEQLDFKGIVADKHSIGGMPGTRTTPIIVSIIAAAGYTIPKLSSRAITSPAGTADVMEVVAKVNFSLNQVKTIVDKTGGCVVWNGRLNLAPADDVIIRVEEPIAFESYDKIIISILAKKVAASSNLLILDVPVGPTMKIKYVKDAQKFSQRFLKLARRFKIKTKIDINHQFQPTGFGIGPQLEMIDVIRVLEQQPDRPLKLEYKTLKLASRLLDLCLQADNKQTDGLRMAEYLLSSGKALDKFREIVQAQGGDPALRVDQWEKAKYQQEIKAIKSGRIAIVNNYHLSAIAKILGAPKDKKAGLILHQNFDAEVNNNDILMELHSESDKRLKKAVQTLTNLPVYEIV